LLNQLVDLTVIDVHRFLMLLDLVYKDLLHINWSDVLSTLKSAIELLARNVSLNSAIIEANSFVNFSRAIVPRNV
jgi:hypothetical protein